ncbi:MAG: hotdog family protein [Porticoccaceae bacterium]|nr:hotdog family protein [Porticoccaceae bacterium]
MKSAFDINELVPHSGLMSLLDEVLDYNAESLSARVTIVEDSLLVEDRGVPAWVGIEYMAQAIAAYSGLMAKNAGQEVSVGFLLGTRKYTCNRAYFPVGARVKISVYEELRGDNGLGVFRCEITADGISNNMATDKTTDIEVNDIETKNIEVNDIQAKASLSVFQPQNLDDFLSRQKLSDQTSTN